MPRTLILVLQIFASGFLIGSLYTGMRTMEFLKASDSIPGTVIQLESNGDTYNAWVEYPGEDGVKRKLRTSISSSPPAYHMGERVTVRVAKDGSETRIDGFLENWFFPLFLGIFALAFGGFGFGPALYRARMAKQLAYLKQMGESLETFEVEVAINDSYSVNGKHPYYLRCKAKVDGVDREFKSANLWSDPTAAIAGKPIRIWYLAQNPKTYQVDLAFLDDIAPSSSR